MPARPYWKGQIRLALVSIPVEVYSATRSGASVSFRQIHEPSGKPIQYLKSVPGIGPVDAEDIIRGYEYEKGHFVLLEDDELDAVRLESKKTLELTMFVDADAIDVTYYEKPYYVVPADDLATEAFVVLREALKRKRMVGLGQLSMRGREYVVSIKPCGRGLVMETLRYADELAKAQSHFRDIPDAKADPELLDLAESLIAKKTGDFKPEQFKDRYIDALKDLVARKLKAKGRKIEAEPERETKGGSNVIDLMAALKKSLEKPGAPPAKPAAAKKAPARKRA
jgi:DNA end-binding protein Ku